MLRISKKHLDKVKREDKAVSIDGIKKLKYSGDDLEFFELEGKQTVFIKKIYILLKTIERDILY